MFRVVRVSTDFTDCLPHFHRVALSDFNAVQATVNSVVNAMVNDNETAATHYDSNFTIANGRDGFSGTSAETNAIVHAENFSHDVLALTKVTYDVARNRVWQSSLECREARFAEIRSRFGFDRLFLFHRRLWLRLRRLFVFLILVFFLVLF